MKKEKGSRFGFTLVEMMIVVSIVGMLASIVIVSSNSARKKSRTAQSLTDLAQIHLALEAYQSEHARYPVSTGGAGPWDGLYSDYGDSTPNWIPGLTPLYMITLPRAPSNTTSGSNQYIYQSDGRNYKIIYHTPEDCAEVQQSHPELIDPVRNCWAYGYWSPGAASW